MMVKTFCIFSIVLCVLCLLGILASSLGLPSKCNWNETTFVLILSSIRATLLCVNMSQVSFVLTGNDRGVSFRSPLPLYLCLCVSVSVSVCLSLSLSLSHTHTHTYARTHARTHVLILIRPPPPVSQSTYA